jgi:hypothetical protein
MSEALRVATFNASLNRGAEGHLVTDLSTPDNVQVQAIAEIVQKADADILLINEFDCDSAGLAAELFRRNYLAVGQNRTSPVDYPYFYAAPSNPGVASGFDLNNDGTVGGPNDADGSGFFPGQFAFVIYSKYPIDEANIRPHGALRWQPPAPKAIVPVDQRPAIHLR